MEVSDKMKKEHPELSRDTCAKILNIIYKNKSNMLGVCNDNEFREDKLF